MRRSKSKCIVNCRAPAGSWIASVQTTGEAVKMSGLGSLVSCVEWSIAADPNGLEAMRVYATGYATGRVWRMALAGQGESLKHLEFQVS